MIIRLDIFVFERESARKGPKSTHSLSGVVCNAMLHGNCDPDAVRKEAERHLRPTNDRICGLV